MVEQLIGKLHDWGCDTAGALERMINDNDMYVDLLTEYVPTVDLQKLDELIATQDVEETFDYVHSLKGVLGNLGLTPLYKPICDITEILRAGSFDGIEVPIEKLKVAKRELDILIAENSN